MLVAEQVIGVVITSSLSLTLAKTSAKCMAEVQEFNVRVPGALNIFSNFFSTRSTIGPCPIQVDLSFSATAGPTFSDIYGLNIGIMDYLWLGTLSVRRTEGTLHSFYQRGHFTRFALAIMSEVSPFGSEVSPLTFG